MLREPRVAIAHDYLTQRGGAERVVLAMARAFPDAPIYTSLYDPERTFPEFKDIDVRVTGLNRLPLLRRHHRMTLPLLPFTVGRTRTSTPTSCWPAAAAGRTASAPTDARSSTATPPRAGSTSPAATSATTPACGAAWPSTSSARGCVAGTAARRPSSDEYLSISTAVQQRIRDCYDLDSTVVPAPFAQSAVDETPGSEPVQGIEPGYYLCVSRLLPYKNIQTIIDAFNHDPSRRLVIVGRGPEQNHLRNRAAKNVTFIEEVIDSELAWLYHHCQALIAIGWEDYGLTPIEAAAAGKPSIVLRWGGYFDTMIEGKTAVFIDEPSAHLLRTALAQCEQTNWDEAGHHRPRRVVQRDRCSSGGCARRSCCTASFV